jgi:hypothetical protein
MQKDPMSKNAPLSKRRRGGDPGAAKTASIVLRDRPLNAFLQALLLALVLSLLPTAAAALAEAGVERWSAVEDAAASASSPASAASPRISPHAIAARQHALAASAGGHSPTLPPTLRRTRQAIGKQPSH